MKHILITVLFIALAMQAFSQGYWPEYTKVKEERYGDGQYWEYDAINYLNYPYTIFDHVRSLTIPQQIENSN